MKNRLSLLCISLLFSLQQLLAQSPQLDRYYLLKPDRVFDGERMHEGWQVLVKNDRIMAVGTIKDLPANVQQIALAGKTLLPGLIEGHSHLFLHPYNETSWNDQVLKESRAERVARATVHARNTLMAGFTTVRDLGTEGAGYDEAGYRKRRNPGAAHAYCHRGHRCHR